ncbi:MAG: shikimate kinase [Rhizobiaceae bacterium]
MTEAADTIGPAQADVVLRLGKRSVVFVGLMGAGKTAIGRLCAKSLGLPFLDSDHEIETASRLTVPELFELYGEPEFRALEQRVIQRLLGEGPQVLSTGGGAFMNAETRHLAKTQAVTVWLKADLDTLMARVIKKQNRPLLKNADPRGVMQALMTARYPVYGEADITVISRDEPRELIAREVIDALAAWLDAEQKDRQA